MEQVPPGNNVIAVRILNVKRRPLFETKKKTFIRDYSYEAYLPQVKQKISDMAMNGSGIRDTARVLGISLNTVIDTLKKSPRPPSRQ